MSLTQLNGLTQIRSGTVPLSALVSGYSIPTANLAQGALFLQSGGGVSMTASLNLGGNTLINVGSPVSPTDGANKSYVDAKTFGVTLHGVRWVSTANVSALSGLTAIDGGAPVAGDVVLLTAQTTASQNGPWAMASGAWARPAWWASASSVPEGNYFISDPDGTTYKNTKWFCNTVTTIVVDTTAISFVQDASGTSFTNGNGISLTGTVFAVKLGNGMAFDGSNNVTATADPARLLQVVSAGFGIKDGTAGQLLMANASGNASYQTVSGDVSITSAGVTTVNSTSGIGFMKYGSIIPNETPGGAVNGANTAFTLANTPIGLELTLNGSILEPGAGNDYTISGSAITMLFAPATGDKLRAYYFK